MKVSVDYGLVPATYMKPNVYTPAIADATRAAMNLGGSYLQGIMQDKAPNGATGLLRSSIQVVPDPFSLRTFVGPTGSASLYARWAHDGRAPGKFPPVGPIAYWVARVGLPAEAVYPIRRKIGLYGTKGRPFVSETYQQGAGKARQIMQDRLVQVLKTKGVA